MGQLSDSNEIIDDRIGKPPSSENVTIFERKNNEEKKSDNDGITSKDPEFTGKANTTMMQITIEIATASVIIND